MDKSKEESNRINSPSEQKLGQYENCVASMNVTYAKFKDTFIEGTPIDFEDEIYRATYLNLIKAYFQDF